MAFDSTSGNDYIKSVTKTNYQPAGTINSITPSGSVAVTLSESSSATHKASVLADAEVSTISTGTANAVTAITGGSLDTEQRFIHFSAGTTPPKSASFSGTSGSVSVKGTPSGSVTLSVYDTAASGRNQYVQSVSALSVSSGYTPAGDVALNPSETSIDGVQFLQDATLTGASITETKKAITGINGGSGSFTPTNKYMKGSFSGTKTNSLVTGVSVNSQGTVTLAASTSTTAGPTYIQTISTTDDIFVDSVTPSNTYVKLNAGTTPPQSASFSGTSGSVSVSGTPSGSVTLTANDATATGRITYVQSVSALSVSSGYTPSGSITLGSNTTSTDGVKYIEEVDLTPASVKSTASVVADISPGSGSFTPITKYMTGSFSGTKTNSLVTAVSVNSQGTVTLAESTATTAGPTYLKDVTGNTDAYVTDVTPTTRYMKFNAGTTPPSSASFSGSSTTLATGGSKRYMKFTQGSLPSLDLNAPDTQNQPYVQEITSTPASISKTTKYLARGTANFVTGVTSDGTTTVVVGVTSDGTASVVTGVGPDGTASALTSINGGGGTLTTVTAGASATGDLVYVESVAPSTTQAYTGLTTNYLTATATKGDYTPGGSVTLSTAASGGVTVVTGLGTLAPSIALNTTSINSMTGGGSVATLKEGTTAVSTLTTVSAWSAGSVPSRAARTVATGIGTAGSFSVEDKFLLLSDGAASLTGAMSTASVSAAFTGTAATISISHTPAGTITTTRTTSGSGTTARRNLTFGFSGTAATNSTSYTPAGTIKLNGSAAMTLATGGKGTLAVNYTKQTLSTSTDLTSGGIHYIEDATHTDPVLSTASYYEITGVGSVPSLTTKSLTFDGGSVATSTAVTVATGSVKSQTLSGSLASTHVVGSFSGTKTNSLVTAVGLQSSGSSSTGAVGFISGGSKSTVVTGVGPTSKYLHHTHTAASAGNKADVLTGVKASSSTTVWTKTKPTSTATALTGVKASGTAAAITSLTVSDTASGNIQYLQNASVSGGTTTAEVKHIALNRGSLPTLDFNTGSTADTPYIYDVSTTSYKPSGTVSLTAGTAPSMNFNTGSTSDTPYVRSLAQTTAVAISSLSKTTRYMTGSHSGTSLTVTKGDYTPAGSVSLAASSTSGAGPTYIESATHSHTGASIKTTKTVVTDINGGSITPTDKWFHPSFSGSKNNSVVVGVSGASPTTKYLSGSFSGSSLTSTGTFTPSGNVSLTAGTAPTLAFTTTETSGYTKLLNGIATTTAVAISGVTKTTRYMTGSHSGTSLSVSKGDYTPAGSVTLSASTTSTDGPLYIESATHGHTGATVTSSADVASAISGGSLNKTTRYFHPEFNGTKNNSVVVGVSGAAATTKYLGASFSGSETTSTGSFTPSGSVTLTAGTAPTIAVNTNEVGADSPIIIDASYTPASVKTSASFVNSVSGGTLTKTARYIGGTFSGTAVTPTFTGTTAQVLTDAVSKKMAWNAGSTPSLKDSGGSDVSTFKSVSGWTTNTPTSVSTYTVDFSAGSIATSSDVTVATGVKTQPTGSLTGQVGSTTNYLKFSQGSLPTTKNTTVATGALASSGSVSITGGTGSTKYFHPSFTGTAVTPTFTGTATTSLVTGVTSDDSKMKFTAGTTPAASASFSGTGARLVTTASGTITITPTAADTTSVNVVTKNGTVPTTASVTVATAVATQPEFQAQAK